MFEYLERIRQRPPEERMRITILTAGVITGVIFLVWLTVVVLGRSGEPQNPAPRERSFAAEKEKISEFWGGARERFQSLKQGFQNLRNSASE